jgi:hypothetical protein
VRCLIYNRRACYGLFRDPVTRLLSHTLRHPSSQFSCHSLAASSIFETAQAAYINASSQFRYSIGSGLGLPYARDDDIDIANRTSGRTSALHCLQSFFSK